MKRIYSTYTEEQVNLLKEQATQRNMTTSEYQRYLVLLTLPISKPGVPDLTELSNEMFAALSKITNYNPFIISSLFDPDVWISLNGSEKRTLAMQLSHYIRKNPTTFEKLGDLPGKISQYQKKGAQNEGK